MKLTRELAAAFAWDAGVRSARDAGRKAWSAEDAGAAIAEFDRLWPVELDIEESRAANARRWAERDAVDRRGRP